MEWLQSMRQEGSEVMARYRSNGVLVTLLVLLILKSMLLGMELTLWLIKK